MRFWDASAIVPLLIHQEWSARARSIREEDTDIVAWWCTPIETASAIARLRRDGALTSSDEAAALRELEGLRSAWHEILAGEQLRAHALRILRLHPLRSADALQLAAALDWAGNPAGGTFVSFDQRLAAAAELEGFRVIGL
jgi:predicted nucleic acid-binding protein